MKKFIIYLVLLSFGVGAYADPTKLHNYSLQDTIQYLAEIVNNNKNKRENDIIRQDSAKLKDDTLEITKVLEAIKNDMNSAILVDTIIYNYENGDKDFVEDFIESQINLYCESPEARILFEKGGFIRIILKTKNGKEIADFDLAKNSCQ